MGKTPPAEAEADGSPRNKAARVDDPSSRKTASKGEEAEGSPPKASATGKTPPKEAEADGSPRNNAARVDDPSSLIPPPVASVSSTMRKTAPKGEEAEGSPPKKSPRLQDKRPPTAALPLPMFAESSELTGKRVGRASEKKWCKCNYVITDSALEELSAIQESSPSLMSRDEWTCYGCWREDKNGIVKTRPPEREILMCVTCCNHLCCGVGSIGYPFGHSRAHALEKKHWFAVLCCDPERGYCFKCNAEVPMLVVKFGEADIITPASVGALITAAAPSLTDNTLPKEEANDEKRCNCNHVIAIEKMESWFKGAWTCCECREEKSDLLICVTCCDHPCCRAGPVAYPFVHSRAHALKKKHWFAVMYCYPERGFCFKCNAEVLTTIGQKLLAPLPCVGQTETEVNTKVIERTSKFQAENHPSGQSSGMQGYAIRGLPNLGNTCYMNAVLQCLFVLGKLQERMMALDRPKGPLAEVLEKLFAEASDAGDKLNLNEVLQCVQEHREPKFKAGVMEDSHELLTVLCEILNEDENIADSIFGMEMLQTLSCKKCGFSLTSPRFELDLKLDFPSKCHPTSAIGSEVIAEKTHGPSEVDSTQAQHISQSSPLQIQKGMSVDSLTGESMSIEHLLLLYSKEVVEWCCPNCAKNHKEPSASPNENCELIVGRTNEDDVRDTDKTLHFTTLPPVLTLHINRTSHQKGTFAGIKIIGHVRFSEYLDIEHHLKDPSSVDKVSKHYRLAGVIEHIGEESLNSGHYIAYVRARRLGNQQESSSCSSSWFCANDIHITHVSIEEVLKIDAYILFYERMEDRDREDVLSWEIVEYDEIVNSEDNCSVHEEEFESSQWSSQLLHSKYANRERIERLQTVFEWVGQFSNLADIILPAPVSSIVVKASSHIDQVGKVVSVMSHALQVLQSVIPPPDRIVVLGVANSAQARHAVSLWNDLLQPQRYCVKIMNPDQIQAVKEVLDQMNAGRLLWRYHPELCASSILEEDASER